MVEEFKSIEDLAPVRDEVKNRIFKGDILLIRNCLDDLELADLINDASFRAINKLDWTFNQGKVSVSRLRKGP